MHHYAKANAVGSPITVIEMCQRRLAFASRPGGPAGYATAAVAVVYVATVVMVECHG